ncbi:hypothetical protein DPMN_186231 [Dreissena polymorpha]|uniref:Uncharacterized protein n=1 Tax=Dreissena polymorpha TaxID=45954 RepID=A0A9D4I9E8_DREPO|nr:hypothetical protein DPMN_186231 [Dreissena polymorpha]
MAGLWFLPAGWCIRDRDHCEALCRPSILPLPSGSSGWLPPLGGHLPCLRCSSAGCPCSRTTARDDQQCPGDKAGRERRA